MATKLIARLLSTISTLALLVRRTKQSDTVGTWLLESLDRLPAPYVESLRPMTTSLPKIVEEALTAIELSMESNRDKYHQTKREIFQIKESIYQFLSVISNPIMTKSTLKNTHTNSPKPEASSTSTWYQNIEIFPSESSHSQIQSPLILMEQHDSTSSHAINALKEFLFLVSKQNHLPTQIPSSILKHTAIQEDHAFETESTSKSPIIFAGHFTWGELPDRRDSAEVSAGSPYFSCMTTFREPVKRLERCLYRQLWSIDHDQPPIVQASSSASISSTKPTKKMMYSNKSNKNVAKRGAKQSKFKKKHHYYRRFLLRDMNHESFTVDPTQSNVRSYRCLSDLTEDEFLQLLFQKRSTTVRGMKNTKVPTMSSCLGETMRVFSGIEDEDLLKQLSMFGFRDFSQSPSNTGMNAEYHSLPALHWLFNHTLDHLHHCPPLIHELWPDTLHLQLHRFPSDVQRMLHSHPLLYSTLLQLDPVEEEWETRYRLDCPPLSSSSMHKKLMKQVSLWENLLYATVYEASKQSVHDHSLLFTFQRYCVRHDHFRLIHQVKLESSMMETDSFVRELDKQNGKRIDESDVDQIVYNTRERKTILFLLQPRYGDGATSKEDHQVLRKLLEYATGLPLSSLPSSDALTNQFCGTLSLNAGGSKQLSHWLRNNIAIHVPPLQMRLSSTTTEKSWKWSIIAEPRPQSQGTMICQPNKLFNDMFESAEGDSNVADALNRLTANVAVITKDPFYLIWKDLVSKVPPKHLFSSLNLSAVVSKMATNPPKASASSHSHRHLLEKDHKSRLTNSSLLLHRGGGKVSNSNSSRQSRRYHKQHNANHANQRSEGGGDVSENPATVNSDIIGKSYSWSKADESRYREQFAWLMDRQTYLSFSTSTSAVEGQDVLLLNENIEMTRKLLNKLQFFSYLGLLESAWSLLIHGLHDFSLQPERSATTSPTNTQDGMKESYLAGLLKKNKLFSAKRSLLQLLSMSELPTDVHRSSCSLGFTSSILSPNDQQLLQYDIPAMKTFYLENSQLYTKVRQLIREQLQQIDINEKDVHFLLPLSK